MKRVLAASIIAFALVLGAIAPASAAPTTQVVQGQYLRIVSTADWQAAANLRDVAVVPWDLTVSADAPEPGTMTLSLSALGGTPLLVDALLCAQAWTTTGCPSGAQTLRVGWSLPRDGSQTELTVLPSTETAHLRLNVSLAPGGAADLAATELWLHARGVGKDVVVPGGGGLATTGGVDAAAPRVAAVAAGLLAAGVILLLVRRRTLSAGVRT